MTYRSSKTDYECNLLNSFFFGGGGQSVEKHINYFQSYQMGKTLSYAYISFENKVCSNELPPIIQLECFVHTV